MSRTATPPLDEADLIWQQCLFAFEEPTVHAGFDGLVRTQLDDTSWVDIVPGWLRGADLVFEDPPARVTVTPGQPAQIPPQAWHHVELTGPVRLRVEFYREQPPG